MDLTGSGRTGRSLENTGGKKGDSSLRFHCRGDEWKGGGVIIISEWNVSIQLSFSTSHLDWVPRVFEREHGTPLVYHEKTSICQTNKLSFYSFNNENISLNFLNNSAGYRRLRKWKRVSKKTRMNQEEGPIFIPGNETRQWETQ